VNIMVLFFGLFLFGMARGLEDSIGNCTFSQDCKGYEYCQLIADAYCACNFGQCILTGGLEGELSFRDYECQEYTDCPCKDNPDECFCDSGICEETRYECHDSSDCKKLSKCSDKECACSGFFCEFECSTTDDCKDFSCNKALGYKCKCENSFCDYEKKPTECKSITDCVSNGLCEADKPCDCTQEYCTLPWWLETRDDKLNCRSDEDCEETIAGCAGKKCFCANIEAVTDWEERGTCLSKDSRLD